MKKWTTYAALAILGAGATSYALRGQITPAQAATEVVSFDKKVAPFTLPDPAGKSVTVGDWNKSKATVLLFVATRCPVSNAYNTRMESLVEKYSSKGIKFVGINSNKAESGPDVAAHSKQNGVTFTVLKDPNNKIADLFNAQVTPEAYIVGPSGDLLYHGRIDNSQNESEVKSKSLQVALDSVVAGQPIVEKETRAFGCSIKRVN